MVKEWCVCLGNPKLKDNIIVCKRCNKPMLCEFCENDTVGTVIHFDYVTCKKHEEDAIDAVYCRGW